MLLTPWSHPAQSAWTQALDSGKGALVATRGNSQALGQLAG
ncbi:MAG TPA: hypothetical protein VKB35_01970 [Ktedonobacteraceae bacterium]|nr:hypothetical protein [Ktedonobacteraceae bacterium]